MKRFLCFLCFLACMFCLGGCDRHEKTVSMELNFSPDQVQRVEMFHYVGSPATAQKKVITDPATIEALYFKFETLKLKEQTYTGNTASAEVTSFRFCLEDGTNFDLVYYGYGVKTGELFFPPSNHRLFTSADIGWNWRWLDESLEAVPARQNEIPQ